MKLTEAQRMAKRIQDAMVELNRVMREAQQAGMEVYPGINGSMVDNPWRAVHVNVYVGVDRLTND